jgi:NAD(P)-dependent dehydrogenase (short-subunit alcohol dehydrogenase family)
VTYTAFDLTGKVALVTEGNGSIGLGMARALVEASASICIWGTNPEKNTAALAELEDLGADAQSLECDVGDREQVESNSARDDRRYRGRVTDLIKAYQ